MSPRKINISSSSEDDDNKYAAITDEKKRKRMISNRESARRSRMKREQHIKDLNDQITYYRSKSSEISQKINEIGRRYAAVEADNRILRMHGQELKKRLQFLDEMMASYNRSSSNVNAVENNDDDDDDDDCFVMNILQDPDFKPWLQPPFQSQTVDGIYQF